MKRDDDHKEQILRLLMGIWETVNGIKYAAMADCHPDPEQLKAIERLACIASEKCAELDEYIDEPPAETPRIPYSELRLQAEVMGAGADLVELKDLDRGRAERALAFLAAELGAARAERATDGSAPAQEPL